MTGLFEITKIEGRKIKARSSMNNSIEGVFFVPPLYRQEITDIETSDIFFGIFDEASGYGAILYLLYDEVTSDDGLVLSHDLDVKGTIRGKNKSSRIDLSPQNTMEIAKAIVSALMTPQGSVTISGVTSSASISGASISME